MGIFMSSVTFPGLDPPSPGVINVSLFSLTISLRLKSHLILTSAFLTLWERRRFFITSSSVASLRARLCLSLTSTTS